MTEIMDIEAQILHEDTRRNVRLLRTKCVMAIVFLLGGIAVYSFTDDSLLVYMLLSISLLILCCIW